MGHFIRGGNSAGLGRAKIGMGQIWPSVFRSNNLKAQTSLNSERIGSG